MKKKYKDLKKIDSQTLKEVVILDDMLQVKQKKSFARKTLDAVFGAVRFAIYLTGGVIVLGEVGQILGAKVKDNSEIWNESEALKVDIDMIKEYGGAYSFLKSSANKLPHNGEEPIYVTYSENISKEDKKLYENALNYYESLFETIDDKYKFKEISQTEAYMRSMIGQSVITFDEESLEDAYGYNATRNNMFKWDLIRTSKITISKDLDENPIHKYSVIVHEIAHSFGLGDGFDPQLLKIQSDTFMHANNFNLEVGMFYPNDLKTLHILYNKKLSDKNGNFVQEEIEKVNEEIKAYENEFYEKVTSIMKGQMLNYDKIVDFEQEVLEKESLILDYFYLDKETNNIVHMKNQFKFDFEDNKLDFKILDSNNQVLYQTQADIIVREDIIYIPRLNLEEGPLPHFEASANNLEGDSFLAIFKTNKGYFFYNFSTGQKFQVSLNYTKQSTKQSSYTQLTEKAFEF